MKKPMYTVEPRNGKFAIISSAKGPEIVHAYKATKKEAGEFADDCNRMMENFLKSCKRLPRWAKEFV